MKTNDKIDIVGDYMSNLLNVIIDDNTFRYMKFGNGKKNLIIIPGLYLFDILKSKDIIEKQYSYLSSEYSIYLFERKVNIPSDYTIYDFTNDYIKIFNKLNLKDLYLFGTSMGGIISLLIASKTSFLVKKLILAGTTSYINDDESKFFIDLVNYAKNNKLDELLSLMLEKIYTIDFYNANIELFLNMKDQISNEELNHFIIAAKTLINLDIRTDIKNINVDTFIVSGDKDKVFNITAIDEMKKYNKHLRYKIIEGGCHAFYDLDPNFKDLLIKELF